MPIRWIEALRDVIVGVVHSRSLQSRPFRRVSVRWTIVVTLALVVGACSESDNDARQEGDRPSSTTEATTTSAPGSTTAPAPPSGTGVGPYRTGDCIAFTETGEGVEVVDCDRPHDYEVTVSDTLPAELTDSYPSVTEVSATVGPDCASALHSYAGTPDVEASRLETNPFWPTQPQWDAGDRWFACLIGEYTPEGRPARRTGTLRGALDDGLGELQHCLVEPPTAEGPRQVVPCDQPHRAEAVPGVLVLGEPTDPPPSVDEMLARSSEHCSDMVETYLGGERPGVTESIWMPHPDLWSTGETAAVCYATSEQPVSHTLGET